MADLIPVFLKVGKHSASIDITTELLADEVAFAFVMHSSLRKLRAAQIADPAPTRITFEAAAHPNGWLPIETAPRDGTDIFVGFDSASVWVSHIAWWRDKTDPGFAECGFNESDIGWWSYTRGSVSQDHLDGWQSPTHWMPLPAPPKSKG